MPNPMSAPCHPVASNAPATRLGHVHLKVRDARSSADFYAALLGLQETENLDDAFIFLSAGHEHHALALQSLGNDAVLPEPHGIGLYHSAWEVSDPGQLACVWDRLAEQGHPFSAVDHGISWALYLADPDGNGIEVYLDRRDAESGSSHWNGRSRRLSRQELPPSRVA